MTLWLLGYVVLGTVAGFFAGLLGVGGGAIMVPVLALMFAAQGFPETHLMHLALGTSMAAIFGVEELTGRALNANAISFRSVEIFSIAAGIYIVLTIIASLLLWLVGRWLFRVKARVF